MTWRFLKLYSTAWIWTCSFLITEKGSLRSTKNGFLNHRSQIYIIFLPLYTHVPHLSTLSSVLISLPLSPSPPSSLLSAFFLTHCSTDTFYQNFGPQIPLFGVRNSDFSTQKSLYPFISNCKLASLFMHYTILTTCF